VKTLGVQTLSPTPTLKSRAREALDVEHVDLVDEQDAGHELGHAFVVCGFGFLGFRF
jgi:hypothetical protein